MPRSGSTSSSGAFPTACDALPEWLIATGHAAAQWSPLGPLTAVLALALVEAVVLPARLWAKGAWVLAAAAIGMLAYAAATWEQQQSSGADEAVTEQQLAALHGLWTQWDAVAQSLPAAPAAKPGASFETVEDALASLSAEVAAIKVQIELLRTKSQSRAIDGDAAAKLADYLRQFGPHRVVVSCAADDVEAYTYANQLANILRNAGWEAPGPEIIANQAGAASMAVSLYTRDPRSPEAARILVDAFGRFNIPYHAGIAPNEAIPDPATAELHVAKKP